MKTGAQTQLALGHASTIVAYFMIHPNLTITHNSPWVTYGAIQEFLNICYDFDGLVKSIPVSLTTLYAWSSPGQQAPRVVASVGGPDFLRVHHDFQKVDQ